MTKGIAKVVEVMATSPNLFTVRARIEGAIYKHSPAVFLVNVLESGLAKLQTPRGSMMEHGVFEFEAEREMKVGESIPVSLSSLEL